jgi:replicative DNA helicase
VLYVALEPKRVEIVQAITANRAGVGLVKITRAPKILTQDDLTDLTTASHAIASWPLHVVDETERDRPDTVAKIEAAMRALPSLPALVVVDHLLKLSATGRYEKAHQGTAEVVASLVSLGRRTGATLLVLCHIGRAMSGTSGLYRRPRVEDIAGGDAMNRDADGIVILHREDKYPTVKENVENPLIAGHVDLLAPKLRGVEDNTYGRMRFRGEVQRFEAFEGRSEERDDAAQ